MPASALEYYIGTALAEIMDNPELESAYEELVELTMATVFSLFRAISISVDGNLIPQRALLEKLTPVLSWHKELNAVLWELWSLRASK
jgi:hypothetical protein